MIRVYWLFVAYVSPVLLVVACAYLAWRSIRESREMDLESALGRDSDWSPRSREFDRGPTHSGSESHGGVLDPSQSPPERDAWSADPDAWKKGS